MSELFNSLDYLDTEEAIAGYLSEAVEEGPDGFLDALNVIAKARMVNQLTKASGINRELLCEMFSGNHHLDETTSNKGAWAFRPMRYECLAGVCVPCQTSAPQYDTPPFKAG
ncbi:MAG: hypothetical protein LBB40_01695, partial [Holophagales bacterium]|nr:hypothetical protein [Holophagales bacterium]